MKNPKLSAFGWVPPFAQGLVRDLRVRWAFEEAGIRYEERVLKDGESQGETYRKLQPFGQVPALEVDGWSMFESGAIVWQIAEKSEALLPKEPVGRARAMTWVFAAINTIEPAIGRIAEIDLFNANTNWGKERRPEAFKMMEGKLQELARYLEGREYLEDRFTAGDLMMGSVLRVARHTDVVAKMPVLDSYLKRLEARPAFQRALAQQMKRFEENKPAQ